MDVSTLVQLGGGALLVIAGAELLVRGASRLAAAAGIPPLIVGLSIVALGTSSPELAVSLRASFSGGGDVGIGNIVGSNIFNILFIIGISAVVTPLIVAQRIVRLDVPIVIGVSVLLMLLGLDGRIGRLDGLLLFAGIVVYIVYLVRESRRESAAVRTEYAVAFGRRERSPVAWMIDGVFLVAGLLLLAIGARLLVDGAVVVATALGVSQLIIGLTIVAAGTSLPEVATSVMAGVRGERDIAVGNAIGSNLYNILAVVGLSALVAPDGIPVPTAALTFDIPVMITVAIAALPIFFTGYTIARWEGLLFLGYYGAYTTYVILAAAQHDALPAFSRVMAIFVVPLTAVTLAVLAVRAARTRDGAASRSDR